MAKLEYQWLLPSMVEMPRAGRRSTRDWVVDGLLFAAGLGFTLLVTIDILGPDPAVVPQWRGTADWLVVLDLVTSVLAAFGLWWRRGRFLLPLATLMLLMSTYTVAGAVTGLIVLLTVAVHCRFWVLAAYSGLTIAFNLVLNVIRPDPTTGFVESLLTTAAITVIVGLWGMVVRSRRLLVVSLRERAERSESEQQLRVDRARYLERNRIAHEMHDVLAHRLSLLSLHAGALEVRADAPPEQIAEAAAVVRASAHQALEDLREVITVLREEQPAEGRPEQPQPTLDALPALADESRSAGTKVRLDVAVESSAVPAGTGRTAYRIVQEGLTNARKHAPGTAVRVAVGGGAGEGLTIEVRNPWPVGGRRTTIPGAGTGLIGLTERATLAGGRLSHGRTPDNDFALTAWLPWP